MHAKTLAIGFSALGVLCKMLDWCPCAEMGKGKFHIWQLFPSLLGLGGGGVGGVSGASAPIPSALLVPNPRGPGFPLSPWNPAAVEVALQSQCWDLGHFPAQTGLAGDFLP